FSIPAVIPLLIASACAAVVSKLIYSEPLFVLITEGWVIEAFWYYLLFGIIVGLFSVYYSQMNYRLFKSFGKIKNRYNRAWIGGAILGVLIALMPALYGEGYITIQ